MQKETLKTGLKEYSVPEKYPGIYAHNFAFISNIDRHPGIERLIRKLAGLSGLPEEIVSLDIKKFLMHKAEYPRVHGHKVQGQEGAGLNGGSKMGRAVSFIKKVLGMMDLSGPSKAEVLVDDWSEGAIGNFYGKELIGSLRDRYVVKLLPLSKYPVFNPWVALPRVIGIISSYICAARVEEATQLSTRSYARSFIHKMLTGLTLKRSFAPKVIISGNDSDFPIITGKCSGAEIVLIQNARKNMCSVQTFCYADHFFALGDLERMGVLQGTGCVFRNIYPLGSIRLHNSLNSLIPGIAGEVPICDVLWISDLVIESSASDDHFGGYYLMKNEYEAIELLNDLAEKTDYSIIYKCRDDDEVIKVRERNIVSDKIRVVGRSEIDTYRMLTKAKLVLSSLSTVVLEAIGIGVPAGLVNMSGNSNLNCDLKDLGIEFNKESKDAFPDFVSRLITEGMRSDLAVQKKDYVQDLVGVVSGLAGVSHGGK